MSAPTTGTRRRRRQKPGMSASREAEVVAEMAETEGWKLVIRPYIEKQITEAETSLVEVDQKRSEARKRRAVLMAFRDLLAQVTLRQDKIRKPLPPPGDQGDHDDWDDDGEDGH